jgi:hypothetical protein
MLFSTHLVQPFLFGGSQDLMSDLVKNLEPASSSRISSMTGMGKLFLTVTELSFL